MMYGLCHVDASEMPRNSYTVVDPTGQEPSALSSTRAGDIFCLVDVFVDYMQLQFLSAGSTTKINVGGLMSTLGIPTFIVTLNPFRKTFGYKNVVTTIAITSLHNHIVFDNPQLLTC